MEIDKNEMKSRLWAEWTNGLKIMMGSLLRDQVSIVSSACVTVLGNENFIQRAVMYVQRKTYIGKFKDYKLRIAGYEKSILELVEQVNRSAPTETQEMSICRLKIIRPKWKIDYKSTLDEIIIDGDDRLENEAWGDHAIAAYEKLVDYLNNIMDVLTDAQKKLEGRAAA